MTPNDYQQLAGRTLIDGPDAKYTPEEIMLAWNALGLAGEAGEVADIIKKSVFHRHELNSDNLIKELGDVLWYVAAICTKIHIPLEQVMALNIEKLQARYPDGYSSVASQARKDDGATRFRCARCQLPLNNVSPGFSVIAGGQTVCTPCLHPGEEIARAR